GTQFIQGGGEEPAAASGRLGQTGGFQGGGLRRNALLTRPVVPGIGHHTMRGGPGARQTGGQSACRGGGGGETEVWEVTGFRQQLTESSGTQAGVNALQAISWELLGNY